MNIPQISQDKLSNITIFKLFLKNTDFQNHKTNKVYLLLTQMSDVFY